MINDNLDPDFTIKLFKWKHLENPFGKSYGLLAFDGTEIIGLRMFMFWKFWEPSEENLILALRPVDTVVDKNYRGQGIFKRLTLMGLEKFNGDHSFIFNTPNKNSLPGLLKMGWEKYNFINCFKIGLINPYYGFSSFVDVKPDEIKIDDKISFQKEILKTYTPLTYFKWRYQASCFRIAYFEKEQTYIVYSINKFHIIVFEITGYSQLNIRMLNSLGRKFKKALIYFYEDEQFEKVDFLLTLKRYKPNITLRNFEVFKDNQIKFSLADLDASF
ncbi:GNAT family N-acetyltransferase [Christiangramia gaetbulicola]|uniref:GNAT family N-acetyltransferase n=1 Tax=Christiangramia gaetbulicola TaxID=703340 RepID=UPI0014759A61|nr:GNAT family N-acetyltransferase [Christiangramia gaetbulicola]